MKRLVGSQDEESPPAQKARPSWLNGGDAQEMDVHGSAWSDWAILVTDGTTECITASSIGSMLSSRPGVMLVR